jgi:hypothetical protein
VLLALALTLLLPSVVQGEEDRTPSVTSFREASNGYDFFALAVAPAEGEEGAIGLLSQDTGVR